MTFVPPKAFKQIGPDKFVAPSGKVWTREQLKAYYSKIKDKK